MALITALTIGSALAKGASGIAGSIAGHNDAVAQARARNEALKAQYKQQLRIRDAQYKFDQSNYANRLGEYDLGIRAADKAASRAYGVEQLNSINRIRKASLGNLQLNMALASKGGTAVASGKTGSGLGRDVAAMQSVARGQAMNLENLLSGNIASDYRRMGIQDQLTSQRNRMFSQIATAPRKPLPIEAPTQYTGPSTAGRNLSILNAGVGLATGIAGAFAPNVGNIGGGAPAAVPRTSPGMGIPGSVGTNGLPMYGPSF